MALLMNIIFNLMYSYLDAFPSGISGWMMIVARALVGFGGGTCVNLVEPSKF